MFELRSLTLERTEFLLRIFKNTHLYTLIFKLGEISSKNLFRSYLWSRLD